MKIDNRRSDGNIHAALGSPCTKIIERMNRLSRFEKNVSTVSSVSGHLKSIFTSQEEADFNFICSKLNGFSEAKCHESTPENSKTETSETQEKGCLFRYSFPEVLAKNVLSGAIRYDDKFLDCIKFEEHTTFKKYVDDGYTFGARHIDKEARGFLVSLGILTPEVKEDSAGYGSRDYAIYRLSEKSYRFVLWLDYYKKLRMSQMLNLLNS